MGAATVYIRRVLKQLGLDLGRKRVRQLFSCLCFALYMHASIRVPVHTITVRLQRPWHDRRLNTVDHLHYQKEKKKNEILNKCEPLVYTRARHAVHSNKKGNKKRKRLGQYNSNNKLNH